MIYQIVRKQLTIYKIHYEELVCLLFCIFLIMYFIYILYFTLCTVYIRIDILHENDKLKLTAITNHLIEMISQNSIFVMKTK